MCNERFACVDICVYKLHMYCIRSPDCVCLCMCVYYCEFVKASRLMGAHLPVLIILMRWYLAFLAVWYSRNGCNKTVCSVLTAFVNNYRSRSEDVPASWVRGKPAPSPYYHVSVSPHSMILLVKQRCIVWKHISELEYKWDWLWDEMYI